MLDCHTSSLKHSEAKEDRHQLAEQLKAIESKLIEYLEGKQVEVPVIVEKLVEVEMPV